MSESVGSNPQRVDGNCPSPGLHPQIHITHGRKRNRDLECSTAVKVGHFLFLFFEDRKKIEDRPVFANLLKSKIEFDLSCARSAILLDRIPRSSNLLQCLGLFPVRRNHCGRVLCSSEIGLVGVLFKGPLCRITLSCFCYEYSRRRERKMG